ncbi:hypothetical protein Dvina_01560 [Dactylosporangium vinaceum]|uniref:Uncharacterized protein n=1 Tax=Dactylosporangium vinaceum TaxID=53362 RepID=A0ABV5MLN4_9ACTN|nr:hypothetical protein [Dactylosporangium vinaceum]UAB96942.1 hypothetical protein Dvina_01560 [Dactylosporangium vinaceum]
MKRDKLPDSRLGELLSAASAPGRRKELRGEEDAVAGFRQEYRPRAVKAPRRKRRLLAVVATALVAAGIGGTAFAANTGRLPAPAQTWYDSHIGAKPDKTPISTISAGQPNASPPPTPATSAPATDSCRAWVAHRTDPTGARPITGPEKDQLKSLAGGEPAIDTYCDRLLGAAAPSSAPPSSRSPRPSATKNRSPGQDGQGASGGAGNGQGPPPAAGQGDQDGDDQGEDQQ